MAHKVYGGSRFAKPLNSQGACHVSHPRKVELLPPNDVPDLAYGEDPAAPGLKFFHCERIKVTLSQGGCGRRWAKAQTAHTADAEEAYAACRSCALGAAHAGREYVHYSSYYRVSICPRCRKGTTRMIRNRVCVTCRNREYEVRDGRNARGNVPVKLLEKAPHLLEFRVKVDERPHRERMHGIDLFEGVLQTLRTTRGAVEFAFSAPQPHLRQGRLF